MSTGGEEVEKTVQTGQRRLYRLDREDDLILLSGKDGNYQLKKKRSTLGFFKGKS